MRIVKEYPHKFFKVSIFRSDGRYHVKIQHERLALTYTLTEDQCSSVSEVEEWIEQNVIEKSAELFPQMSEIAVEALEALEEDDEADSVDII